MRRFLRLLLLSVAIFVLVTFPIFAYAYSASFVITEDNGNSYDMLPVSATSPNLWMADNGFMTASALDTRVETLGGQAKPHMVAIDRILTAVPVDGDSQTNLFFTTGNTPLSAMDIITGNGGSIATADAAAMELGNDFEIEIDAWVDTDSGASKYLVNKGGAFFLNVSGDTDGTIESTIYNYTVPVDVSPVVYTAWTDVDVSAHCPAGTTGVILHLDANAPLNLNVRKNGSTDNRIHDISEHCWTMVGVDANRIFEAYLENVNCKIFLVGYVSTGYTFLTDAIEISPNAGFSAWTEKDLTASTSANTIGVIIEGENLNAGNRGWGARKEGSGDDRRPDMDLGSSTWTVIGCDASQVVELWAELGDVNHYLIGYIEDTSAATFNTNGVDKSLVGVGAYADIDCSVEAPDAEFLIFEIVGGAAGQNYALKEKGSAEDDYHETGLSERAVVKCNSSQVVEGKISNVAVDFFLVGYIGPYTGGVGLPSVSTLQATAVTSGEYTVVAGEANAPVWATGDVLHFDGTATSNVNAGAIHNAAAKLWISLWFKLDADYSAGLGDMHLFGKELGAADHLRLWLNNGDGKLYWKLRTTTTKFNIASSETSWNAGQWYHILASISDTVGIGRLRVDNGTPVLTGDVNVAPNGGDFVYGDYDDPGAGEGFIGVMQNVVVGTDDLMAAEETDLFNGIAPADAVNYWYTDEGTGVTITDYGTGGNDGTADTNTSWATSTFTTGKTGRWCDFYIQVDDGVADPDRWGSNLKGTTVPNNTSDWVLNTSNVIPYMNHYKHTVSGTLITHYEPNTMILGEEYSTGTATFANGSDVVVGAGTTWTDEMAGSMIKSDTDGVWYVVDTVTDNTHLDLTIVYADAGGAGHNYTMKPRLPDREGAAQDARITWGSNPAGVTVTLDSMVSSGQPGIGQTIEEPSIDILPEVEVTDWYVEPDVAGSLLTNPIRPFVTIMSDTTTLTERQAWIILGTAFVLLVAVATARGVRGHLLITGITTSAAIGVCVAMTIFPMWALVFIILCVAGGVIAERSPSI